MIAYLTLRIHVLGQNGLPLKVKPCEVRLTKIGKEKKTLQFYLSDVQHFKISCCLFCRLKDHAVH